MRYVFAGESHGPCLTAIVEDVPAGLRVSESQINSDLARRQSGYGRGGRQSIERDTVQVTSGIRFGKTIGSPVTLTVRNRDWENWTERMAAFGEAPLFDGTYAMVIEMRDPAGNYAYSDAVSFECVDGQVTSTTIYED